MLTVYVRPGCFFSKQVKSAIEEFELKCEYKDISHKMIAEELEKRGGKVQVPYLVDSETGKELYDAETIVQYLIDQYAAKHL